jgi:hypothetical protein
MEGYDMSEGKWMKQTMYIKRDSNGVIVRCEEHRPSDYKSLYEQRREKAYRATENAEKQITEYARRKMAEKRNRMGY